MIAIRHRNVTDDSLGGGSTRNLDETPSWDLLTHADRWPSEGLTHLQRERVAARDRRPAPLPPGDRYVPHEKGGVQLDGSTW